MDLLETILQSAGFQDFQDAFKNNNIDLYTLKIINDQDLHLLGIEDEEKRQHLLKVINNLQIPSEKKVSVRGDTSYALLVLNNISLHLQKQYANLIYINKRKDVDICNIKLTPAITCFEHVLHSMDAKLDTFEYMVFKKPRAKRRKKYIISSLVICSATLFICCRYLLLRS